MRTALKAIDRLCLGRSVADDGLPRLGGHHELCGDIEGKTAMRIHTRACAVFAMLLLSPAAASADDLSVCKSNSGTVPPSAILDACTRLIDSGRYADDYLAKIMLTRGNAFYNKQDYPRALADYTEVHRLVPNDSAAIGNRANAYLKLKKYDAALADYNEAIRLDPKNADALRNRAAAYQATGDFVRAAADRDLAARLGLRILTPSLNLGVRG